MKATAALIGCAAVAFIVYASGAMVSPSRQSEPIRGTPVPGGGPSTDRYCNALREVLPAVLGDLRRRASATRRVDGWGDPPVVLRCGVPPVARPAGDTTRILVAGIAWYSEDRATETRWTTLELPVPVEVVVPDDYQGQLLAQLSDPLRDALSAGRSRAP